MACARSTATPIAQMKPTSSRATAVHVRRRFAPREEAAITTTEALLRFPGEGRDRVWLTALALPEALGALRTELVRPGGFDKDPAQVGIAGLGDRPAVDARAARMLGGNRPAVAHELARRGEARERPDFAHDGGRCDLTDPAQALEGRDDRPKRLGRGGDGSIKGLLEAVEPRGRVIHFVQG